MEEETVRLAKQRTGLAVQRNRMSNERTFLSWIRTGLASVGGGIVVIRLLGFEDPSHQLASHIVGILLVLLGVGIFVMSLFEYLRNSKHLRTQDATGLETGSLAIVAISFALLSIALLLILFREI